MARHFRLYGGEGKTKAAELEVELKTPSQVRQTNSKWRQRGKKQLLNTPEPHGHPGSVAFGHWNPRQIRTKVDYLVRHYAVRPLAEWLSPDLLQKYFHPLQRTKLWALFLREKMFAPDEVQVRYDRLEVGVRRQMMVLALFGPLGAWKSAVMNLEEKPPTRWAEKRGRRREWYYWWELEKMFGQQEAHELVEKGQFERKKLGDDVFHYRRLTDAVKLRKQEKKETGDKIQEAIKLSEEAERLCTELQLRLRVVHAQARLNGELVTEPPDIGKSSQRVLK